MPDTEDTGKTGAMSVSASAAARSARIGDTFRDRGLTLSTAESCTAGLLAAQIVAISGSSDYFLGSVVAYANPVKEDILGVSADTLAEQGAVSWQTAVQMAGKVRDLLGADLALSTTGIAGPTGGTPEKPVGTVYIALASADGAWWRHHRWDGERDGNNASSVEAALTLLEDYLKNPEALGNGGALEHGQVPWSDSPSERTPTTVEIAQNTQSMPRPTAFFWQGKRYPVHNWGRIWSDPQGDRHYLVMNQELGTFELVHDRTKDRWYVEKKWLRPRMV